MPQQVLTNVINVFNDLIYKNWKALIWNSPTVSSLAFAIFRINYLKDDIIRQISGPIFDFIKLGYTGGATDLYIPRFSYEDENKYLYYYDVNSLYPSIMRDIEIPCGDVYYFEGDVLKHKPDLLSFCYCNVIAPENLVAKQTLSFRCTTEIKQLQV